MCDLATMQEVGGYVRSRVGLVAPRLRLDFTFVRHDRRRPLTFYYRTIPPQLSRHCPMLIMAMEYDHQYKPLTSHYTKLQLA
jgi:hypothetical protein